MGYILIMVGIMICSMLILVFAKLLHYLIKERLKLRTIYTALMVIVLLPLLTMLIYNEIGNYWSGPTQEDSKRLGEMVVKTINSPDFKKISREETIYAIEPMMSRFTRPKDSYLYEVNVATDKDTYTFFCDENAWVKVPKCKKIRVGGWGGVIEYKNGNTFFKGYKGFKDGKEQ
ncbi:hypothetical protein ETI06_00340 [Macrococcoides goetzii]|nr:hypothetical protein [Macrococcus goetzii]TDM50458.1 hypothetical protein ETI06_00340 [Macrococcus goetzii]